MPKKPSVLLAFFLLFGWAIGSGFWGLPIASGTSGFIPSAFLALLVTLYIIPSALLYIEVILALPDGNNIISLCKQAMSPLIALLIAIFFFYLHYYYSSSYFVDLPPFIQQLLPFSLSLTSIKLLLCISIIAIVYFGSKTISRINVIFLIALLLTLSYYLMLQFSHIEPANLLRINWAFLFLSIPTYVGNYYIASLFPSLATFLQRDIKKICKVIFLAILFFFLFTLLWQFLVFSTNSESTLWIANGGYGKFKQNIDLPQATHTLTYLFHSMLFFSIFINLFIGGMIVTDALFDGLHTPPEKRKGNRRILLVCAAFLPALLFSYFPWIPLIDSFTGWGELFFIGPLPIWLVWKIRYQQNCLTTPLLPGGKLSLFLYGVVNFILIYVQAANVLWVTTI